MRVEYYKAIFKYRTLKLCFFIDLWKPFQQYFVKTKDNENGMYNCIKCVTFSDLGNANVKCGSSFEYD